MGKIWNIGILGCGNIADIYVTNIQKYFKNISITACASLHMKSAEMLAAKYHIPKACTTEEMLSDPEIDAVLNLTVPQAHYRLNKQILNAGKHVYSEKPLADTYGRAEELVRIAGQSGLAIGCAPDTWLGSAVQTCMDLIQKGEIGDIISVTANLMNHGVESWHPSPMAYYQKCGGPIWDMGPYYISVLTALLGPFKEVRAYASCGRREREIYSAPLEGQKIKVEINTTYTGILKFTSGVTGTMHMSFDIWESGLPMFEVYGTEGTLKVPDPNWSDGEIQIIREKEILRKIRGLGNQEKIHTINTLSAWYRKEHPQKVYTSPTVNLRGLGLWDMMYSIEKGVPYKNNPDFLLHIMEVLMKLDAGEENKDPVIRHQCARPESIARQIYEEEGKSICLQEI